MTKNFKATGFDGTSMDIQSVTVMPGYKNVTPVILKSHIGYSKVTV
jgi:hypothetical protein